MTFFQKPARNLKFSQKKRSLSLILAIAFIIFLSAGCITSSDSGKDNSKIIFNQTNGEIITLPAVAERIVVLNSNAAEMLYVLGAGEKVVGVSEAVKKHPERQYLFPDAVSVGGSTTPDAELISSLNPDVIIAFDSMRPHNADMIEKSGIPIVYIDCYKLTNLREDVTSLGIISGKTKEAQAYLEFTDSIFSLIEQRVDSIPESSYPVVYCEFSSDYIIQGIGTSSDILLNITGGKNVLTDPISGSSNLVSNEWIISKDPDVFIKLMTADSISEIESTYSHIISRTGAFSMKAVQNNRTYIMLTDISYGPRSFAGAALMAKILHPDEFSDINVHDLLEQYNQEFNLNFSHENICYPDIL